MNPSNQRLDFAVEPRIIVITPPQAVGESFLAALTARDFDALERIFLPRVRFRSLVPSGEFFGVTSTEAVRSLRNWFGDEDTIDILQSTIDLVEDVLSIQYRLRVHDSYGGWQVIEQHAYCMLREGRIADMRLICSGFHPEVLL